MSRLTNAQRLKKYGNPHLILPRTDLELLSFSRPSSIIKLEFRVHPTIADRVERGIVKAAEHTGEWPIEVQTFNPRKIRGSSKTWSLHSWALALDVFAFAGKQLDPVTGRSLMSDYWRKSFVVYSGLTWGGTFTKPDPHHFEWPL
jgi:hypothetical protein